MIRKFKMKFPAFTGEEDRDVYIYLPKSYRSSDKRYPVLYMFDGHNVFYDEDASYKRSWRLGEYLDKHRTDLIVVGVECNKGENDAREIEYLPFSGPYFGKYYDGKGDDTMKWFVKVLKRKIDEEYRTLSDRNHTYLMGSSMGGIMTTYGLLKYNRYFSRGCSLSPAYFLCEEEMTRLVRGSKVIKGTTLYTDYGTKDLSINEGAIETFNNVNTALIENGVNVTSRIVYKGIHHESTWEKQLPFCIETLMYEE